MPGTSEFRVPVCNGQQGAQTKPTEEQLRAELLRCHPWWGWRLDLLHLRYEHLLLLHYQQLRLLHQKLSLESRVGWGQLAGVGGTTRLSISPADSEDAGEQSAEPVPSGIN